MQSKSRNKNQKRSKQGKKGKNRSSSAHSRTPNRSKTVPIRDVGRKKAVKRSDKRNSRPDKKTREKRRLKRILPKLKPGWKRYIDSGVVERVVYCFRIEAVVSIYTRYQMSFSPKLQQEILDGRGDTATLQMYHTKFMPTIPEAVIDLREKAAIMGAYGGIKWVSVDLYQVSGAGPLREKHWKLLGEYDEPNDVPGF